MHVEQAHESGNGVCRAHREADRDIGEPAGDGDGRRYGLELGVPGVGAEHAEGRDHEYEQPVVERELQIQ